MVGKYYTEGKEREILRPKTHSMVHELAASTSYVSLLGMQTLRLPRKDLLRGSLQA